jgi:hypothetical protein
MTTKRNILSRNLNRKVIAFTLLSFLAAGAFATLGDGSSNKKSKSLNILSDRSIVVRHNGFSLKSGYNYRGNNVINPVRQDVYINLNTTATFQKGNRTYILPIKSKVLLNNVKLSAGVPQLNR